MDPVERAGEYIGAALELQEDGVRWLQEETLDCERCKYTYKVRITPEAIPNHYKIQD